jgi:hypothetical protein
MSRHIKVATEHVKPSQAKKILSQAVENVSHEPAWKLYFLSMLMTVTV